MEWTCLAPGLGFLEGPVITQAGEIVVTSLDRGCVYACSTIAGDGDGPRILAVTGGGPNGATEGPDGTIYVAQNGGINGHRRPVTTGGIQAIRPDGRVDWITQDMVSPNDLCFGPDGYLYVTDPTRRPTRDDGRLWRVDVETWETELLLSTGWYPNGIGFGLEDDAVYVASTGESAIVRMSLDAGGLGRPEVVARLDHNLSDGFAFDVDGNILVACPTLEGDGDLQVFDRDGRLLEVIRPRSDDNYTNVAVDAGGRVLLTDSRNGDLLAADGWPAAGLPLHPFRS